MFFIAFLVFSIFFPFLFASAGFRVIISAGPTFFYSISLIGIGIRDKIGNISALFRFRLVILIAGVRVRVEGSAVVSIRSIL